MNANRCGPKPGLRGLPASLALERLPQSWALMTILGSCLQAEVRPQCGRTVGFSSGSENPHGVKAVTRGQRCAIALWFTLDARHSERVSLGWLPFRGTLICTPFSCSFSPASGLDTGEHRPLLSERILILTMVPHH